MSSVSSRNNYVATTEWLSADNIRRILGKVKVESRRIFHQFCYVFLYLQDSSILSQLQTLLELFKASTQLLNSHIYNLHELPSLQQRRQSQSRVESPDKERLRHGGGGGRGRGGGGEQQRQSLHDAPLYQDIQGQVHAVKVNTE